MKFHQRLAGVNAYSWAPAHGRLWLFPVAKALATESLIINRQSSQRWSGSGIQGYNFDAINGDEAAHENGEDKGSRGKTSLVTGMHDVPAKHPPEMKSRW